MSAVGTLGPGADGLGSWIVIVPVLEGIMGERTLWFENTYPWSVRYSVEV